MIWPMRWRRRVPRRSPSSSDSSKMTDAPFHEKREKRPCPCSLRLGISPRSIMGKARMETCCVSRTQSATTETGLSAANHVNKTDG